MSGSAVQAAKRATYPAYKASGVAWLGDVPEHWDVDRAKWTVTDCRNGIWGEEPDGTNDLPCVRVADFNRTTFRVRIDDPTMRAVTPKERRGRLLQNGDLLLEKSGGGDLQPVGAVMQYDHDVAAVCANFIARMPVANGYASRFLAYLHAHLNAGRVNTRSIKQTTGIQNLDSQQYLNEVVVHPPLDEQKAIATFLDRETARIDALIEKKRRQIELLQEKRSALISHAATKGLNPNAPMKSTGFEWLGRIPAHWQVLPIKRVARMDSGHTPDKKVEEYWTDCTIPWVSLNDTAYLKDHDYIDDTIFHVNELGLANSSAHLLPERVVLFTRDATIGLSAITTRPMAVSQHIIAWICGPRIMPEYLLRVFYSMTQELERLCMGSTIRTLGMPDVLELVTPLPPVEEQKIIVKHLETEIPKLVALVAKIEESIRLLIEHRAALIAATVTGKIDVSQACGRED